MSNPTRPTPTPPTPAHKSPESPADGDAGQAEVAKKIDAENEQGFRGTEVDKTDNEAYTLPGIAKGMPTPETDADAKAAATKRATTKQAK